jgi:hypothetical protein
MLHLCKGPSARDGLKWKQEVKMWHGSIKGFVGIWLIISAIFPPLQHPLNMLVTGFVVAICCFSSQRLWQAITTGIVGVSLFLSGLHDLTGASPKVLVTQMNFLISGLLLVLIGLFCVILISPDDSAKSHLKVS